MNESQSPQLWLVGTRATQILAVSPSTSGRENNSVPDYGVDAQEVMNRQIPSDYDISLGIFWTRLGTPTGRFGSGTQEEIEDAIGRRGTTGNPHVAIYF